MLPAIDADYLGVRFPGHSVVPDAGLIAVVLPAFRLPPGFTAAESDLLLRLAPGYPDVPPDMWWFSPKIVRCDGAGIRATESQETYLERSWQRWSRHFQAGQWNSGIDSLQSYLALVDGELRLAAQGVAA
jgi:Prokaryotic E2 family E